jgi:hypothetical protein
MPRGTRRRNADDSVLVRSAELIGWAVGGIEREIVETRERLAALMARAAQLRTQAGHTGDQRKQTAAGGAKAEPPRRRKMSAEGRKRIADAARRRWAKWRAQKQNAQKQKKNG